MSSSLYDFAVPNTLCGSAVLLIIGLSSKGDSFPVNSLREVDDALVASGFHKEVHSVLKPGKEFSLSYQGPNMAKGDVEAILMPIAEKNGIALSVETEESIRFP